MSCMICAVNHKKGCSGVQDGYLKDDVHTALRYAKVWIVGVWAAMFPMRSVTCPRVPSQIVCYASLSSISMKGAISSYLFFSISLHDADTLIYAVCPTEPGHLSNIRTCRSYCLSETPGGIGVTCASLTPSRTFRP